MLCGGLGAGVVSWTSCELPALGKQNAQSKNIITNCHQVTEITVKIQGNALIKLGTGQASVGKSVGAEESNTKIG